MQDFTLIPSTPVRITLGGMLKYKQATGRDWGQTDGLGVADLITYLWANAAATATADSRPFATDLETFAASLSLDILPAWAAYLEAAYQPADTQKKTTQGQHPKQ